MHGLPPDDGWEDHEGRIEHPDDGFGQSHQDEPDRDEGGLDDGCRDQQEPLTCDSDRETDEGDPDDEGASVTLENVILRNFTDVGLRVVDTTIQKDKTITFKNVKIQGSYKTAVEIDGDVLITE